MKTSNRAAGAAAHSCNYVVEWQLVRTAERPPLQAEFHAMRERIKALEVQGMTLLHQLVAKPREAATQELLSAVDSELMNLRTDLAWRKLAWRD